MKRMTALFVAIALLACVLTGCAKAGFKADGTIKAKDEDGKLRSYRLVEIKKEDGQVNLFVQGSEDNGVCAYAFGSSGFDWQIYIDASIVCDGQTYAPVDTIPYLSSRDGNLVQFVFDTDADPESIRVFVWDYPEGAAEIEAANLDLDPELYVSDEIVTTE
mgnify:CR=1 FL=1